MTELSKEEMLRIHLAFCNTHMATDFNIVGVSRIKRTPFKWSIIVTCIDPRRYKGPWEFEGMDVVVEKGYPGINAIAPVPVRLMERPA